jgi:hypothetical protein
MSLFKNNDIDTILLFHLDLIDDYAWIKRINKYYYKLISNDHRFKSWLELYLLNKKDPFFCVPNYNGLFINACVTNNECRTYLIKKFPDIIPIPKKIGHFL